jgi:hypothetical protein
MRNQSIDYYICIYIKNYFDLFHDSNINIDDFVRIFLNCFDDNNELIILKCY